MSDKPSEFDILTREPESMVVGHLNRVVRSLRERLYEDGLRRAALLAERDRLAERVIAYEEADRIFARDFDCGTLPECPHHAEVSRLQKERDEARESEKAAWARAEAVAERLKYEEKCGCMVDGPDDVCGVHSPAVKRAEWRFRKFVEIARRCAGGSAELDRLLAEVNK